MSLVIVELTVKGNEVSFLRIPEGHENEFCSGVRETYSLSDHAKIEVEDDRDKLYKDESEMTFEEKIKDIKEAVSHDNVHNDGMMISLGSTQVRWLVHNLEKLKREWDSGDLHSSKEDDFYKLVD